MSHQCPAEDCDVSCDKVLMCRQHWKMVPRFMRTAVNNAFGAHLRASKANIGRLDAWRDYMAARQQAVALVNGKLNKL